MAEYKAPDSGVDKSKAPAPEVPASNSTKVGDVIRWADGYGLVVDVEETDSAATLTVASLVTVTVPDPSYVDPSKES